MPSESPDLTPMIRQYREIKEKCRDAILMYRIGDFYEMFFDDAVTASKILDIVLTSRNKKDENPVPLCGIPYRSVQPHIAKLVERGHKVAVCDQVEDPREAKGVVRREVTRIITPGLSIDLEDARRSSFLAALVPDPGGFSFIELSTGEFFWSEFVPGQLPHELAGRPISEVILPEGAGLPTEIDDSRILQTRLPDWVFEENYARRLLQEQFRVATLSAFGCEERPAAISAAGAILHYIRETQKVSWLPHITALKKYERTDRLLLSAETARSLDLPLLMDRLDETRTAMGGRKLRDWLARPLTDREKIDERLETVGEMLRKEGPAALLREALQGVCDLGKMAGRLSLKAVTPRDLAALATSLRRLETLKAPLAEFERLQILAGQWDFLPECAAQIEKTILPNPPLSCREGGIIADGASAELAKLRNISRSAKETLARLEKRERERTGIPSLKVRFNKVFGYFLEVTSTHLNKVPPDYLRQQTLVNAERYVTPELKEFEGMILGADEKIRALEFDLFEELCGQIAREIPRLKTLAVRVAELDTFLSFAATASKSHYVRPEMREESVLQIEGGRHPLVEASLPPGRFVANDLFLEPELRRLLLITGPNMAGKSTVIRQAGLIVVMAQAGSFVPASRAVVGIVDRLFSRIGASDRLTAGESTFMVEMTETANLLHHATGRSLILLDEIGRGTSTFDGISIAWAVAEYLHDKVRARTLFATHYHELIELEKVCPAIRNYHVAVQKEGGEIVFLYRLTPGGMSASYGIHVAGLAGLPREVLERAAEVLKNLEEGEEEGGTGNAGGSPRLARKRRHREGQIALF